MFMSNYLYDLLPAINPEVRNLIDDLDLIPAEEFVTPVYCPEAVGFDEQPIPISSAYFHRYCKPRNWRNRKQLGSCCYQLSLFK